MSIRGMIGFGGLALAYENMTTISGNYAWVTTPVPNSITSRALTTGVGMLFTADWEGAASSEFWLHAHVYPSANDLSNDLMRFGWANGGTVLGWVSFEDSTNKATIFINGSKVATASGDAIPTLDWTSLVIHVTMHATTGEVEVFMNGNLTTPVVTFTGNTDPTAATDADGFYGGIDRNGDYIANFVCLDATDATGIVDTAVLKRVGITNLAPTGDGNYTAWTPDSGGTGYTQIDEAPPSDADYVEATATAQRTTFTFPASGIDGNLLAARWCSRVTRSGSDAGVNLQVSRRYDSTDYDDATVAAPLSGYVFQTWDQRPDGADDWTAAILDGTEFGMESIT